MNEMTPPKAERAEALKGLGTARKRVEDARFTQGKGNYVDDLKLPGMLFGDFVRSPLCPCPRQIHQCGQGQGHSRRHRRADGR